MSNKKLPKKHLIVFRRLHRMENARLTVNSWIKLSYPLIKIPSLQFTKMILAK